MNTSITIYVWQNKRIRKANRHSYTAHCKNTHFATMTQEQLMQLLLTLTLYAIIDVQLPSGAELKALLTSLIESHAVDGIHPSFRTSALSDWVDMFRQGI
jgi:hypothetical protein